MLHVQGHANPAIAVPESNGDTTDILPVGLILYSLDVCV